MIKQQNTYTSLKINADTLTPVGIFKRLEGTKKFLLESSFQHERKGKFSYVGANPYEEIIGYGTTTTVRNLETNETSTYEMHVLQYFKEHFPKINADLPLPFSGGAIGYIGYDAIRPFTNIGAEKENDLEMPDYHFMVYDTIIAYEHRTEAAHIIALNTNEETEPEIDRRIQNIERQLKKEMTIEDPTIAPFEFTSTVEKNAFIDRVNKQNIISKKGNVNKLFYHSEWLQRLQTTHFQFIENYGRQTLPHICSTLILQIISLSVHHLKVSFKLREERS